MTKIHAINEYRGDNRLIVDSVDVEKGLYDVLKQVKPVDTEKASKASKFWDVISELEGIYKPLRVSTILELLGEKEIEELFKSLFALYKSSNEFRLGEKPDDKKLFVKKNTSGDDITVQYFTLDEEGKEIGLNVADFKETVIKTYNNDFKIIELNWSVRDVFRDVVDDNREELKKKLPEIDTMSDYDVFKKFNQTQIEQFFRLLIQQGFEKRQDNGAYKIKVGECFVQLEEKKDGGYNISYFRGQSKNSDKFDFEGFISDGLNEAPNFFNERCVEKLERDEKSRAMIDALRHICKGRGIYELQKKLKSLIPGYKNGDVSKMTVNDILKILDKEQTERFFQFLIDENKLKISGDETYKIGVGQCLVNCRNSEGRVTVEYTHRLSGEKLGFADFLKFGWHNGSRFQPEFNQSSVIDLGVLPSLPSGASSDGLSGKTDRKQVSTPQVLTPQVSTQQFDLKFDDVNLTVRDEKINIIGDRSNISQNNIMTDILIDILDSNQELKQELANKTPPISIGKAFSLLNKKQVDLFFKKLIESCQILNDPSVRCNLMFYSPSVRCNLMFYSMAINASPITDGSFRYESMDSNGRISIVNLYDFQKVANLCDNAFADSSQNSSEVSCNLEFNDISIVFDNEELKYLVIKEHESALANEMTFALLDILYEDKILQGKLGKKLTTGNCSIGDVFSSLDKKQVYSFFEKLVSRLQIEKDGFGKYNSILFGSMVIDCKDQRDGDFIVRFKNREGDRTTTVVDFKYFKNRAAMLGDCRKKCPKSFDFEAFGKDMTKFTKKDIGMRQDALWQCLVEVLDNNKVEEKMKNASTTIEDIFDLLDEKKCQEFLIKFYKLELKKGEFIDHKRVQKIGGCHIRIIDDGDPQKTRIQYTMDFGTEFKIVKFEDFMKYGLKMNMMDDKVSGQKLDSYDAFLMRIHKEFLRFEQPQEQARPLLDQGFTAYNAVRRGGVKKNFSERSEGPYQLVTGKGGVGSDGTGSTGSPQLQQSTFYGDADSSESNVDDQPQPGQLEDMGSRVLSQRQQSIVYSDEDSSKSNVDGQPQPAPIISNGDGARRDSGASQANGVTEYNYDANRTIPRIHITRPADSFSRDFEALQKLKVVLFNIAARFGIFEGCENLNFDDDLNVAISDINPDDYDEIQIGKRDNFSKKMKHLFEYECDIQSKYCIDKEESNDSRDRNEREKVYCWLEAMATKKLLLLMDYKGVLEKVEAEHFEKAYDDYLYYDENYDKTPSNIVSKPVIVDQNGLQVRYQTS